MNRSYIYHGFTKTLCSSCGQVCDGKIAYDNRGVYILKNCGIHGEFCELLEELPEWHFKKPRFDKPGTVSPTQTPLHRGCPFDCGLCPAHDQHTCIGLIEVTQKCDLECGMCYAAGDYKRDLDVREIGKMMDFYQECEGGAAEILQLSGGEPALHPDILTIIKMAKDKRFKYVMLNTNGVRIAEDEDFVKAISEFRGGFEVYLQFDGLNDLIYENLRGKKLAALKQKAVENLARYRIATTLVATIEKGVNDDNIGEILAFGMNKPSIRGASFQPLAYYGDKSAPADRITLSGILAQIEKQTKKMIQIDDFIPLPCNTERVAFTYLLKDKSGAFRAITRNRDLSEFKDCIGSTFMFTVEDVLKNFQAESRIFHLGACCDLIEDIKKHLPKNYLLKPKDEKLKFVDENTFRISVNSFVDKYNFDIKAAQKECVHIITPELKRIPFSVYNMLHRRKSI